MSTEAEQTTPEVEELVEQEAVELPQEEAAPESDAAFEAGFSGEEPKEPEPEPPKLANLTDEQLTELLAKAAEVDKLREQQSKVFGSLGSLKQSIDALRNQPRPTATAVQVTKANLSKLSEMFPEMAEALASDLSGVLQGGSAPDSTAMEQQLEQKFNQQLQATQMKFEKKVLTAMHPDWQEVVSSTEFSQWRDTLSDEAKQQLETTWDAEIVGSALSSYKDWKSKAVQGQQAKQRRLQAAITPRGSAQAPVTTEDDAFLMGFKKARGIA
jgi:hypothetical protein